MGSIGPETSTACIESKLIPYGLARSDIDHATHRVISPERGTSASNDLNLIDQLERHPTPLQVAEERIIHGHAIEQHEGANASQPPHRNVVGRWMELVGRRVGQVYGGRAPQNVIEGLARSISDRLCTDDTDTLWNIVDRAGGAGRRNHHRLRGVRFEVRRRVSGAGTRTR